MQVFPLLSLLFFALVPSVFAQQYAGQTIPNSLPAVTNGEKAFFNIKDANGNNTTLVNYFSFPNGRRQNTTNVRRAIVILSGSNRDAWAYFSNLLSALPGATAINPAVTMESVAILSPFWANEADAGRGYPVTNGVSTTNILTWQGTGWSGGDTNRNPANQRSVSSYDAMDQILQYFDNKSIYPNMEQIIVAGHSRGAQMAQRYAAVGKVLGLSTPLRYWLGNPNSLLWFNAQRPLSTASCSIYNNWREGLSNYVNAYENAFVQNPANVLARYQSRDIAYARGLNDNGDASDDCAPLPSGTTRGQRLYNFFAAFAPNTGDTVDYESGVGHNAPVMFARESGLYRLFLDNFNGNGSRHADFGARQVANDNPHPAST